MSEGILIFIKIRFDNEIIVSVFEQSTLSKGIHKIMSLINVYIYNIKNNQLALDFLNDKWKIEINLTTFNYFVSIIS